MIKDSMVFLTPSLRNIQDLVGHGSVPCWPLFLTLPLNLPTFKNGDLHNNFFLSLKAFHRTFSMTKHYNIEIQLSSIAQLGNIFPYRSSSTGSLLENILPVDLGGIFP